MPTVSVVIPCYNQGQFVDEAVDSVLAGTYRDFEIIIVNDGSTDPTTNARLAAYDRPCTSVLHAPNGGLPTARNRGITQARGRYILPLDADDRIGPDYLAEGVRVLEAEPNVGIVYAEAEFFGEKSGRWALPTFEPGQMLLRNLIYCTAFFRRTDWETIGGYNPNMRYGWEDQDFWLSLLELGREVRRLPQIGFFYRYRAGGMLESMTPDQRAYSYRQLYHNHPQFYATHIPALLDNLVEVEREFAHAEAYAHSLAAKLAEIEAYARHVETEYRIITARPRRLWDRASWGARLKGSKIKDQSL